MISPFSTKLRNLLTTKFCSSIAGQYSTAVLFGMTLISLQGQSLNPISHANLGKVPVNTKAISVVNVSLIQDPVQVFSSLKYGQEFTIEQEICDENHKSPVQCRISIGFKPQSAGLRTDALFLTDSLGRLWCTVLLTAKGIGPQLVGIPFQFAAVAGNGNPGFTSDGRATDTSLRTPRSIAVDGNGNIYVADSDNEIVSMISRKTGEISIVAGVGTRGFSGDGGPAPEATLDTPSAVAVDATGNLYIADQGNHVIRLVDARTKEITTIPGGDREPETNSTRKDSSSRSRLINFSKPSGLAVDPEGHLFVADSDTGIIWRIDSNGHWSIFAGGGQKPGTDGLGDGELAAEASLESPAGISFDGDGNLYIADSGHNLIRRVCAKTGIIKQIAGNGHNGSSGNLEAALDATLSSPSSVQVDAAGNVFFVDSGNRVLREVEAATGNIVSLSQGDTSLASGEHESNAQTTLPSPTGIAGDGRGNLYVADMGRHAVLQFGVEINLASLYSPLCSILINSGNSPLQLTHIPAMKKLSQSGWNVYYCSLTTSFQPGRTCLLAPSRLALDTSHPAFAGTSSRGDAVGMGSLGAASLGASPYGSENEEPIHLVVVPSVMYFEADEVGKSTEPQAFTLKNEGSRALPLQRIWLDGGNPEEFHITQSCGAQLNPGEVCSIYVVLSKKCLKICKAALNLQVGPKMSLPIVAQPSSSSRPSVTHLQLSSDRGQSEAKITLLNTENTAISVGAISLDGLGAGDFDFWSDCAARLKPKSTCTIGIKFAPHSAGLSSARMTISENANREQFVVLTGRWNDGEPTLN